MWTPALADHLQSPAKIPFLRKTLLAVCAFTVTLLLIVILLPMALPMSVTKNFLSSISYKLINQPVYFDDAVSISLFPKLVIKASNIRVGDIKADLPELMRISDFQFEMSPMTLLISGIQIDKFRVSGANISLLTNLKGEKNWSQSAKKSNDNAKASSRPRPNYDWEWWEDLQISDLKILNSQFTYEDKRNHKRLQAKAITLLSGAKAGEPMNLTGEARVNGQQVTLSGSTGSMRNLVQGLRVPIDITLKSDPLTVTYNGGISKRQFIVSDGRVTLTFDDAGKLEAWTGRLLPGQLSGAGLISADLSTTTKGLELKAIKVKVGQTNFTGEIYLETDQVPPSVNGKLMAESLDLFHFLPLTWKGNNKPTTGNWLYFENGSISVSWSKMHIDNLSAGGGSFSLSLDPTHSTISASLKSLAFYGGNVRGELNLRSGEGMSSFDGEISTSRVNLSRIARQFDKVTPVRGISDLSISVFSVGGNRSELFSAMKGKAVLNISNGSLEQKKLTEYLNKNSALLSFSQLNGSFLINQGIFESDDVIMTSPGLSLVGEGQIDIVNGDLDFHMQALDKPVRDGVKTVEVLPFRIIGSLSDYDIRPE